MEKDTNIGTALVLYTISPALTFEGDESEHTAIDTVLNTFDSGTAKYQGFTFPETPDRLTAIDGEDVTNVFFTLPVVGLTPFNRESDFRQGIIEGLQGFESEITNFKFFEDSVSAERIDILIK